MPATMTRKFILCVFLVMFITLVEIYAFSLHFETRAIVFRAHFVILMEIILFIFSRCLWTNLADFEPTVRSSSSGSSSSTYSNSQTDGGTDQQKSWTVWKTILLTYLFLSQVSYLTNLGFIGKDPHWFAMLTYGLLGSYMQLATATTVLTALNTGCRLLSINVGSRSRASFLTKRTRASIAILYSLCATFYGLTAAAQLPMVRRVTIPVRDLSPKWHNTRIVQISDIHLGPTVGFSKLSSIVGIVNKLHPDLVVMTGDLVDGSVKVLNQAVAPMSWVKSTYGNFFVTGNHEYYTGDVDNWLTKLKRDLGFMPLHNTNVKLIPEGGSTSDAICLAGGDDIDAFKMKYTGHGLNVDDTLKSCDPAQPVILLVHQPRAAKQALESPYRVDLVLAGHTHGGQIFPMTIMAYFANPFFAGLYRYGDGSYVYVSQGTQYWGIPMRLGSSMEVTLITLQAAQS